MTRPRGSQPPRLEVLGVHPVEGHAGVHLLDVAIEGPFEDVDWTKVTQADSSRPRHSWPVVWDERPLGELDDGRARAAIFFHRLDVLRPLLTPSGPLPLPAATPMPEELAGIEYHSPS